MALVVAACAVTAAASSEASRHHRSTRPHHRGHTGKPGRDPRVSPIRQVPTAMIWARDRQDGRDSVHIDTEGSVTGVYNHSVLRFSLPAERRGEFHHFLETSGDIADSTTDAPHFRLRVHGSGFRGQSRAERRAVTSWLVSTAASAVPDTVDGAFNPLMFVWINSGGAESGQCDTVLITYAGEVSIYSCKRGTRAAVSWLNDIDLANVYHWVDSVQTFTSIRTEGEIHAPTHTRTTMTLRGFGVNMPSDSLKNALHSWAQLLATRARVVR